MNPIKLYFPTLTSTLYGALTPAPVALPGASDTSYPLPTLPGCSIQYFAAP